MTPTDKTCISCGMPLRTPDDYPLKDTSKDFCLHCADERGDLKPYDEALIGMSAFLRETQGLDETAAVSAARAMMARMPAWKDHGTNTKSSR